MQDIMDLYTDYLLSSFDQTTATGLSDLLGGAISHDQVSRLLSKNSFDSKQLWLTVKPLIRKYQSSDACLIFDDTIIEKPHTDENALVCWHWDHSKQQSVKGINILTAFYHSQASEHPLPIRLPIQYELVLKTVAFCEIKTKKIKRKAELTKNEQLRGMIQQCIHNQLMFKYILADSWYASSENMLYIHRKKKFFIFDMKANRQVALSEEDRNKGHWTRMDQIAIEENTPVKVWLKDLAIPVLLVKQVFTNKDNNTGVRFLVSNDFSLTNEDFTQLYKKRWSVEEYHKSLKQNASAAKSPTKTVKTQSNHLFCAMVAYIKMEKLKLNYQMNHFALKSKLYLAALKAAFKELAFLKLAACSAA